MVVAAPKFSKQASRPLYIFLALSRRIVVQLSTVNMAESHFTVVRFQLTKGQLGLISQVMLYTTTLRSCYSLNINSKSSTSSCMCFSLSQIVVNLTSTTVCTCRYGTYSHSQWSNACKAELQAQMIGLVASRVQFLLFYTKISLETISVGPNFSGGSCPHTP